MTNVLEVAILRAMLTKDNWNTLKPVITADLFDDTASRRLHGILEGMHAEYTSDLSLQNVQLTLHSVMKTQTDFRGQIEDILVEMSLMEDVDSITLHSIVRKFCARAMSMKAVEYVAAHIDDDNYDPSVPGALFLKASEMSVYAGADILDYATAVSPDENIRTGVVGYGFSEKFDGWLDGGKGPGELSIYCSISGVGKTSMLLLDASNAASLGLNVLYITKEINRNKCVQRLDQCYSHMDKYALVANAQSMMRKRASIPGKIWIQDWSHTHTTVADIRALILQMRRDGMRVDYLVVDYMELIEAAFFNRNQPRFNFTEVVKDLRALANEFWIPVCTAWQAKRLAANKQYLEKDDLGEDWNVVKTADIIIGLNQNQEENRGKVMRVNIIKQRESTNRSTMNLYADLDRMMICEHGMYGEEEVFDYGTAEVGVEAGGSGLEEKQEATERRAPSDFA